MHGSPMITGDTICRGFREKELREQAAENEKVVYILGCPTIVRKGWLAMTAMRTRKALRQAVRGADRVVKVTHG